MARGTGLRSGLVEDYFLTFDELNLLMALRTGNVFVPALQREHSLLVVEERGSPLLRVMAFCTPRYLVCVRELCSMRILVAVFALSRRRAEIHISEAQFEIRRAMAFGTTHCAMCSGQRKLRRSMIERRNV